MQFQNKAHLLFIRKKLYGIIIKMLFYQTDDAVDFVYELINL